MTGIRVRNVSPELAQRYADQGWWTPDTLGDLLARGLKDNPHVAFRVHSSVRPFAGTFGDVELMARRLAAVSVEKNGVPVPAAKITTRPFSRWRTARRRM